MDRLDRKVLAALDSNPRMSTTQLGKKARVSQQVADYRMKRLVREGIITKFGTVVNLKALRQEHYRVFFRFNAKQSYDRLFAHLRGREGVYWAARIGGKNDLLIVLFVKDFEVFDAFIEDLNKTFPNLIRGYTACYGIDHRLYHHKYLHADHRVIAYGYNDPVVDIDELDHRILEILKDDCRASSVVIAQRLDTSYKTVINRIKALERDNVILGYRLFLRSQEDRPYMILLSFKGYSKAGEKALLAHFSLEKQVTQIVRLFGIWNLCVHVRIRDEQTLQEFMIGLRDRFDIIDNYEFIPVFEDIAINLMPINRT